MIEEIRLVSRVVSKLRTEINSILSKHETSKTRIITIEQTKARVGSLSIKQEELLNDSIICLEHGLFRASHVMAWASFIDFLEEKMSSDGLVKAKTTRADWCKYGSIEEVREYVGEYTIIEVAKGIGLISKSEMKRMHGFLSIRNECAHPSNFYPNLNEALGYLSNILQLISGIKPRSL
jgi:hypothetical protein